MIHGDLAAIICVTGLASFLVGIRTDSKTVQTLLRHSDVKLDPAVLYPQCQPGSYGCGKG
jgi:hypothetical protein